MYKFYFYCDKMRRRRHNYRFLVILSSFIDKMTFYYGKFEIRPINMTFRPNSANIHGTFTKSAKYGHSFFFGHSVWKSATFELFGRKIGHLATVDKESDSLANWNLVWEQNLMSQPNYTLCFMLHGKQCFGSGSISSISNIIFLQIWPKIFLKDYICLSEKYRYLSYILKKFFLSVPAPHKCNTAFFLVVKLKQVDADLDPFFNRSGSLFLSIDPLSSLSDLKFAQPT